MSAALRRLVALLVSVLGALTAPGALAASSQLDVTFGDGGKVVVPRLGYDGFVDAVVQPDGRVVAVGLAYTTDGYRGYVVRRRGDGSADPTFPSRTLDAPGYASAEPVAAVVQPDGKLVVVGDLASSDIGVWRLLPTGEPDTGFGGGDGFATLSSGGNERSGDLALGPDGTVVVVGQTSAQGGQAVVYRLTAAGVPDTTFDTDGALGVGPTGTSAAYAVAVRPDGQLLLAGRFQGSPQGTVYALTAGGGPDRSFGGGDGVAEVTGTAPYVSDLLLQADGSLLVAGGVYTLEGSAGTVVRLTPRGEVDPGYGGPTGATLVVGGDEWVDGLAPLPDGHVAFLGSTFVSQDRLVGVLDAAGRPDTGFGDGGVLLTSLPRLVPRTAGFTTSPEGRIVVVGDDGKADPNGVLVRLRGSTTVAAPTTPTPPAAPVATAPTCHGRTATLVGTEKADRLTGTPGSDVVVALGGADVVTGLGGDDVVCAGAGDDRVSGGAGRDRLYGEAGRDRLVGGSGQDRLVGGPDRDRTRQ